MPPHHRDYYYSTELETLGNMTWPALALDYIAEPQCYLNNEHAYYYYLLPYHENVSRRSDEYGSQQLRCFCLPRDRPLVGDDGRAHASADLFALLR